MKKETGIAVFLGILAGIAIALFVIVSAQGGQKSPSDLMQGSITPTIVITTDEISPIDIQEPTAESITSKSKVTVKGSAQKGALVVIQSPADEVVFTNNAKDFSQEISLAPGENTIKITTYSHKNIDSKSVVIYSLTK